MNYVDSPNHCWRCKHFMRGNYDDNTGFAEPDECNAIYQLTANGEVSENTAIVLTGILFTLSNLAGLGVINQCPMWQNKYKE